MKPSNALGRVLLALIVLAASSSATAQVFRTYLASTGDDANPCTRQAPCRLLPTALAAAADGGEVWMLDSANFNTSEVSITKSVSILAIPGAVGSVVATGGGNAISISTPEIEVSLRNLVVKPLPGTSFNDGVAVTAASVLLSIEESIFSGFEGKSAISFSASSELRVVNAVVRDSANGVLVSNQGRATVSGSTFFNVSYPLYVKGDTATTSRLVVTDSVVTSSFNGVYALTTHASATVRAIVTRLTISGCANGIRAESPAGDAIVTVATTTITLCNNSFNQSGGSTLESLGDNVVRQNSFSNLPTGTVTVVPKQ